MYGGDAAKTRHSALDQINRQNVAQLSLAWQFDTGEKGDTQTQPIVVGRVLYGYTPNHKAFALDAAAANNSGCSIPGVGGVGANRGLMYWSEGTQRRVFAAVDNFVYALDANTGKPILSFRHGGPHRSAREPGARPRDAIRAAHQPGVIYRDLMIVGGRVGEVAALVSRSCARLRRAHRRSCAGRFRTIPQPGETGHDTWPADAWKYIGGANSWSGMSLDAKRGLVFVPTGSAAADFYGGNRLGDNLYANTLLALDAATGKLRWHYQFVKHDLLDRDLPTAPTLVTVNVKGKPVDALAQTTKQGYLFLLRRDDGQPLFPVEQVPAPASDVPGEVASKYFLRPTVPAPLARQTLSPDDLTRRTPEAAAWAREQFKLLRSEGPFSR